MSLIIVCLYLLKCTFIKLKKYIEKIINRLQNYVYIQSAFIIIFIKI